MKNLTSESKKSELKAALLNLYKIAPWEYGVIVSYLLALGGDLENINKELNNFKINKNE